MNMASALPSVLLLAVVRLATAEDSVGGAVNVTEIAERAQEALLLTALPSIADPTLVANDDGTFSGRQVVDGEEFDILFLPNPLEKPEYLYGHDKQYSWDADHFGVPDFDTWLGEDTYYDHPPESSQEGAAADAGTLRVEGAYTALAAEAAVDGSAEPTGAAATTEAAESPASNAATDGQKAEQDNQISADNEPVEGQEVAIQGAVDSDQESTTSSTSAQSTSTPADDENNATDSSSSVPPAPSDSDSSPTDNATSPPEDGGDKGDLLAMPGDSTTSTDDGLEVGEDLEFMSSLEDTEGFQFESEQSYSDDLAALEYIPDDEEFASLLDNPEVGAIFSAHGENAVHRGVVEDREDLKVVAAIDVANGKLLAARMLGNGIDVVAELLPGTLLDAESEYLVWYNTTDAGNAAADITDLPASDWEIFVPPGVDMPKDGKPPTYGRDPQTGEIILMDH